MNRILMSLMCILLFTVSGVCGGPDYLSKDGKGPVYSVPDDTKLYRAAVGFVIGASIADAATSWRQSELNPLLRGPDGRFGVRGLAVKAGLTLGVVVANHYLLRRSKDPRRRKLATAFFFVVGGVLVLVAVANLRR